MTTDLRAKEDTFTEIFNAAHAVLNTLADGRFADVRERGIHKFREYGVPTHRDEEFKYLSLRNLNETAFQIAYGATVSRGDLTHPIVAIDAITLAFVNGQYAPELSTADTLPDGVYVGPFEELPFEVDQAFEKQFGRVANLVGKLGTTNDERFTYLNQAFFADIAVIYVPENVVVERPIHILNLSTANRGSLISAPRAYAYFSANSQAKLIESFIGLEGNYLNVPVTEVVLESGAIVEHVRVQDETLAATHIGTQAVHQDAASNYTAFNVNFGGQIYRNDLNVWLNGSGTETRLDGVNVGTDNQVMDNHTRIDHAFPHCNSFEVYKSVLRDNAQGIFNGKIFVYEDAQKTDAKQTNQALLLSATAQMNSKPQLEIFADDVKCTHGATIGQLQKDALFYLQARGIPKAQAESLLVYAFANDVLSRISSEAVRQALENRLFDKLEVA